MARIGFKLFFFISLLLPLQVFAQKTEYLKAVLETEVAGAQSNVDWETVTEPRWQALSEAGQYEFFWLVRIIVPKGKIIDRVASKASSVGFEKDPKKQNILEILIKMQAKEDDLEVVIKDQESLKFHLRLVREKFFSINRDCENSAFKFNFDNLEAAGLPYIAIRCGQGSDSKKSWVNIFLPDQFQIKGASNKSNVNLFTSEQLKSILKSGELEIVGPAFTEKLVFNVEAKPDIKLPVISEEKVAAPVENKEGNFIMQNLDDLIQSLSHYRFGFGMASVSVETSRGQDASVRPVALVDLEMRPGEAPISVGLTGLTLLSAFDLSHYITHTETIGHAHYHLSAPEESLQYELRGYWYMSDGVSKNQGFIFSHNLITGGGKVLKKFSTQSMSAEVIFYPGKNYLRRVSFFLEDLKNRRGKSLGWFLSYTNEKVQLGSVETGYLTQTEIGGFLNF
jgi:hypothetical protein